MSFKETILIVDDTLENLQLLSNMLNEQGYGVRVAVNGAVALKSIKAVIPNLILLDINMPQMNGYEVCKHLKLDPDTAEVPVIFMSALNDVLDKVKAFSVGGADYITKPFEFEEVLARIENQLQNIRLRKKLQESELQEREKAEKLAEALQKIQDFQNQVNTEKMLMLGKVVSGISYEISNPINFIFGNIGHINQYIIDLVEIVESYQKFVPNPSDEIQAKVEDCDLYFIKSDLPKVLNSMKIGAKRIADTILSLQKFSQQDTSGFQAIDLHERIEISLMILQHRLKEKSHRAKINVKKNYGRLPLIECLPGHLSQVFMNLLSHSIDALDSVDNSPDNRELEIKIDTEIIDFNWVKIKISNNGKGMEKNLVQRIFDPNFELTGLGLSISYQIIVEKHQGKLGCSSILGEKTEFIIELPISQKYVNISSSNLFE